MVKLLVVVAHPDDETFGTGSVIAHAAASGVDVSVCCATRGELGEDMSGTTSSPEELAKVREDELRAAAGVLGASDVVLLDFGDSGMDGEPPPYALTAVPLETVVRAIAPVIERVQPDVVVALDPDSVRDHRDHMRVGEATTRAFELAAPEGARLYYWTLAREIMRAWQDEMNAQGLLEEYGFMELGRCAEDITTVIDVAGVYDVRQAAIAAHATQLSPFTGLSEDLAALLLTKDHFVRAVPPWTGGPIETSIWD